MGIDLDQVEFNSQNDIKTLTKELRKLEHGVRNRLQSILYDNRYVKSLKLNYPLVPNERCGLWYLDPKDYDTTAYFKSTDGHTNEWKFSYRRLNLHLIPIISAKQGIVIVDSTRKGKLLPDALLKTIPIWCSVLNCLSFGLNEQESHYLRLPSIVPEHEKNEIVKRIPGFVKEAQRLNLVDSTLDKPLVPYWIYPGREPGVLHANMYHIVCVSASDAQLQNMTSRAGETLVSWQYVQGSADDHELWVKDLDIDLTPELFWHNIDNITTDGIITCTDEELVKRLNVKQATSGIDYWPIRDTGIYFGIVNQDCDFLGQEFDTLVVLSKKTVKAPESTKYFQYDIESNKKGSKALRDILPKLVPQIGCKSLIVCDTGKDLSIGIVLVLLCQRFDLQLNRCQGRGNKDLVKQFLRLINDIKVVNPSRNTLQSVNSYICK